MCKPKYISLRKEKLHIQNTIIKHEDIDFKKSDK